MVLRRTTAALVMLLALSVITYAQQNPAVDHGKRILELLRQEKFAEVAAEFNAQMTAALPPEMLAQVWSSLQAQVGPFRSVIDEQSATPAPGITAVTLGCQFERAALNMIVAFDSADKIAGLRFVPRPAAAASIPALPSNLKEEQVTVGAGEWALPGTLTLPAGSGSFPGVVLVHGSGPNDRDETIGPNKPFRDLAWGLAERGMAVLRYEKRTRQHALKFAQLRDFTVREETVDDALLAVKTMRTDARIDADRIFVLGHSLGGTMAPLIAMEDGGLAGLIIMAGSTRPLAEVYIEQVQYLSSLDPKSAASLPSVEDLKRQAAKVMDPSLPLDTPASELMLGLPASYWRHLNAYDPVRTAANLRIPIHILQGARDYQVTVEDSEGWNIATDNKAGVRVTLFPDLNHLFLPGTGKSTPAEYQVPSRIPAIVMDRIADWITSIGVDRTPPAE